MGGQSPISVISQRLPIGSTLSTLPKIKMRISPSQKIGTALKITAITRVKLSKGPPRRTAAIMPVGTPTTRPTSSAARLSSSVAGMRSTTTSSTGRRA